MENDLQLTVIAKATEEFLQEVRSKSPQSLPAVIEEFAARYPDIEECIEDLFPALVGLEKMASAKHASTSIPEYPVDLPKFNDYEICREIGRGGMGVVYEAKQRSLDRKVALKILNLAQTSSPISLERFQREARIAGSLHHSNIVPVFEVGFENGLHFFSMQYIDGSNLTDLLNGETATSRDQQNLEEQESRLQKLEDQLSEINMMLLNNQQN